MKAAEISAQVGYCKPRARGGDQHIVVPNLLDRQFDPIRPNQSWVTDITYIKTHEGWLYLGIVVDLFHHVLLAGRWMAELPRSLFVMHYL